MNDHRLARLKRLATGAALLSTTVLASEPASPQPAPDIRVNSPAPQPEPVAADAGVQLEQKPVARPKPPRLNSPKPTK